MTDRNYGAIREASKFEAFAEKLIKAGKPIGFDIEAGYTGADKEGVSLKQFHPDYILVSFSFTNSTDWARTVPIAHDDGNNVDDVVRTALALWKMLQTGLGVAHNLSYELKGLCLWFVKILGDHPEVGEAVTAAKGFFPFRSDSMIEVYLSADYDPKTVGKALKVVTKHIFGHQMIEFMDLFPSTDSELGPATPRGKSRYVRFNTRNSMSTTIINYACEDAVWCLAIHELLYPTMKDDLIFRTEMALLPVLVEMEIEALLLDWNTITKKTTELAAFKDLMNEDILAELSSRLGEVVNFSLASPKQLGEMLFGRLGIPVKDRSEKTGAPSTSEPALRLIAKSDPVIKRILEWKEVAKLYGSYLHKYDTELNYAGNGRAYPNHNQTGALTGRLSVDGLSYQQWPKPYHYVLDTGLTYDLNFRDLLVSPDSYRIIGYDFSQVELRILAAMANETAMLKAFTDGVDIHKATAASMFGIPLSEVTKKIRAQGKTLNFAVVYGSGAGNIAEMLTSPDAPVTTEDAQDLLDKYFAAFPKLKGWMDAKVAEGREQGYVHTHFGRKYTVWEYKDPRNFIRSKGDRLCVNAPVQGGAADYMKIGMVRVNKVIKKAGMQDKIRLIMTVHDALEFYVHESVTTQEVIDLIGPAVSFPVKGLPVEIRADWHEGYRWGSVVEINMDANKQIKSYSLEDVDEEFFELEAAYRYLATSKNVSIKHVAPILDELETLVVHEKEAEVVAAPKKNLAYDVPTGMDDLVPDDEDEPSWLHNSEYLARQDAGPAMALEVPQRVEISIREMPDNFEQWDEFLTYIHARPGTDTVVMLTPQGELVLDTKHSLSDDDQPQISLILGGASLAVSAESVPDDLMAGVEL